jgi:uncharacterized protein YdeI (YjbR/CyaY-like superfamily)
MAASAGTPRAIRPRFFATPEKLREWFVRNHRTARELWVGFYKVGAGRKCVTWPEAVDQALCFGWIDGIRKSVGADSYTNRFTPRTPRSTWSAVNIRRAKELIALGLMTPAGLAAFERRADDRSAIYSYEQRRSAVLDAAAQRQFRQNARAWEFFEGQAPSYRRLTAHWVISAKKPETRARRLERLIRDSAAGQRIT